MNVISKYIVAILITFSAHQVIASPQMPDYLIYKNDTIATFNLLVEQYLQKFDDKTSEKLFGLNFRDGANFNCWRGYQAVYKIENDSLFLINMITCGNLRNKDADNSETIKKMQLIFGKNLVNGKVFIDWFSGALNFPLTNKLLRWDGVFYRIFEKETVIEVSQGHILKT